MGGCGGGGWWGGIFAMSLESEEIKTVEQWRWSEMQGIELVSRDSTSFHLRFNPEKQTARVETREGVEKEVEATQFPASMDPPPPPNANSTFPATAAATANNTTTPTTTTTTDSAGAKDEKPGPDMPAASMAELFRFADGLDCILMAIGTAGAIVHGCSLPIFLRFFADLVNSFGSNADNPDKMMQEVLKVSAKAQSFFAKTATCRLLCAWFS